MSIIRNRNIPNASRLKFNNTGNNFPGLINVRDAKNREILGKASTLNVTKEQAIQKLFNYEIADKNNLQISTWYRFINEDAGTLHGGGFLIKDAEKFVALKNVSLNFTFSVQKDKHTFFNRKNKASITNINPELSNLFLEFKDKPAGNLFVLVSDDGKSLHKGSSMRQLHNNTPNSSINGMRKAFNKNKTKYKNFFLFRLNEENTNTLNSRLRNVNQEEQKEEEPGIDRDVLRIINRFF